MFNVDFYYYNSLKYLKLFEKYRGDRIEKVSFSKNVFFCFDAIRINVGWWFFTSFSSYTKKKPEKINIFQAIITKKHWSGVRIGRLFEWRTKFYKKFGNSKKNLSNLLNPINICGMCVKNLNGYVLRLDKRFLINNLHSQFSLLLLVFTLKIDYSSRWFNRVSHQLWLDSSLHTWKTEDLWLVLNGFLDS